MADRLMTKDIRAVRNAVYDVAAKWYDLGLELGISANCLDRIKSAYSNNPEDCLREMLLKWLSISGVNPEPSWKVLCDALRIQAVGFGQLADKILREKCKSCTVQSQEDSIQFTSEVIEQNRQAGIHSETLRKRVVGSRSDSDLKEKQESSISTSVSTKKV